MEDNYGVSGEVGDRCTVQSIQVEQLGNAAELAARKAAQAQLQAARQAYRQEFVEGNRLFLREVCTEAPVELGKAAARLRIDGARSAMLGLLWRFGFIGGVGFVGALYLGFGLGVSTLVLVGSIPVCCVLTLC